MKAIGQKYRIGVIGAGARGETFARQLHTGHPRASLFGICDIDAQRLREFCDYCQLDGAPQFTDLRTFLSSPDLDAVVITTPDFTHADVACAAMAAGKSIYIEKPLAHTLEACHRIVEVQKESGVVVFVGFNLRATPPRIKLREIVASGVLGQILHVEGLEHLSQAHGASFMRRFHRRSKYSGGLLNHKCSHDLDILQWLVGHEHKVSRIASFGGVNVFRHQKQPAPRCGECPQQIHDACPYKAQAGFVFPVGGAKSLYHPQQVVYGGDLCVFNDDKDIVDNQTVILEWEHGVRGHFNLQLFGHRGGRFNRVWGEKGVAELDEMHLGPHGATNAVVRVTSADTGDTVEHRFAPRGGGHGGSDQMMIHRFIDAIEAGDAGDSGLDAGVAASVIALTADRARVSGQVVAVEPSLWATACGGISHMVTV